MDLGRTYFNSALSATVPIGWNKASRAAAIARRFHVEQTSMLPGAATDWVFHVEQVRAAPAAKSFCYVPRGTRLTLADGSECFSCDKDSTPSLGGLDSVFHVERFVASLDSIVFTTI
jgi:hypothetical protein